MIHLTTQQLSTRLDGELSEGSELLAKEHLETCAACSAKLASLTEQEETLMSALRSDPDDAFFERLIKTVEDGTRSAPRPAVEPGPEPGPAVRRRRSASPWGAAIIVAAIVGSLGAINFGIEFVPYWLSKSGTGERLLRAAGGDIPALDAPPPGEQAPGEPAPGGAVPGGEMQDEALPVADSLPPPRAASAPFPRATSAPPPRAVSAPFPVPVAPAARAPLPAERRAPVERTPPEVSAPWEPVTPPAPANPVEAPLGAPQESAGATADSFIVVEEGVAGLVRAAQQRSEEAALRPSVAAHETAADAWERSLGSLHGEAYREARFGLAEARYHAWQLGPNGERASRAAAAIRAYLVGAPPGPERGKATHWLLEVEENRIR